MTHESSVWKNSFSPVHVAFSLPGVAGKVEIENCTVLVDVEDIYAVRRPRNVPNAQLIRARVRQSASVSIHMSENDTEKLRLYVKNSDKPLKIAFNSKEAGLFQIDFSHEGGQIDLVTFQSSIERSMFY